ncbi:MAG: 4-hydroxyphenylacetate-3-hydroxylase, partial [Mycobacterium sp.]|nr:4-hydroxyphenylacetate-3-hydroxylase [Mycobacterium sp.]
MIKTGDEYREAIHTGREIYIDGEQVHDVTKHPMFAPIVDIRARIYDLAHEAATQDVMSYVDENGERNSIANKMPLSQQDWHDKRKAIDLVLDEARGVVTRVGDETVGEMWALYDGQDVLNEVDPRFAENIRRHVKKAAVGDPFH